MLNIFEFNRAQDLKITVKLLQTLTGIFWFQRLNFIKNHDVKHNTILKESSFVFFIQNKNNFLNLHQNYTLILSNERQASIFILLLSFYSKKCQPMFEICNQIIEEFLNVVIPLSIRLYYQHMNRQLQQQAIDDGFSSDQEIRHEQIIVQVPKLQELEHSNKEEVKFKLPPPQQIKSKSYSLNPDIATGWAPKNDLPVPIPLIFQHKKFDCMIRRIHEQANPKLQLVYLGPRYQNTFYAWFQKPFSFPYSHIKAPNNVKFNNRLFCGQNPDFRQGLMFDSFFEGGNLDCSIRVGEMQYDLYIRVDSNTRGHLQWFNFKIKNLEKLQKYKINICNFQKNKSLYNRGMKPYIFSRKRFEKENIEWEQGGDSIKYEKKISKSSKVLNLQQIFIYYRTPSNYRLSFEYYTQFDDDQVQIAYCIPYTYSDLQNFISSLEKQTESKQILSKTKLCTSLGGLQVPLLIIQENKNLQSQKNPFYDVQKKCVVISGRAHPGESNGSHMMKGFLQYICSDLQLAKKLRKYFIFKVVPMLNPDGVILGNYRTGISGKDFNRQYRNPQKSIFPQVFAFKKLVSENKAIYGDNLIMFLDFHGHSTKKNVFMYGPEFPIIQKHYYECRVFPKLLSNLTKMFRYYSCTFKVSEFKETTARAVLLRKLMIPFSFTIQASNGSFYDQEKLKDISFNKQKWEIMGQKIGECISIYAQMIISSERARIQKRRQRIRKREMKKSNKAKSNNKSYEAIGLEKTFLADNQSAQNLFQQIRKAELQRNEQRNDEDQISEGSSDGEGQKDDLSKQKLNFLFSIIKNKKMNGAQKFQQKIIKRKKTFQFEESNDGLSKELEKEKNQEEVKLEYCEISDANLRQNNKTKGYFFKNNKINHTAYMNEQKNLKVTAKIINFSFVGQQKLTSSPRKTINRGDYSEGNSVKKNNSENADEIGRINKKVLDLSDNTFRQTFGSAYKNSDKLMIIDPKSTTFYKPSPRKIVNRLDQFKYRRLFIDEYKI